MSYGQKAPRPPKAMPIRRVYCCDCKHYSHSDYRWDEICSNPQYYQSWESPRKYAKPMWVQNGSNTCPNYEEAD